MQKIYLRKKVNVAKSWLELVPTQRTYLVIPLLLQIYFTQRRRKGKGNMIKLQIYRDKENTKIERERKKEIYKRNRK